MSTVTDEDVQLAAKMIRLVGRTQGAWPEDAAREALAAVLPEYAKRVRADLLRELIEQPVHPLTREWLLSVLERVEGE